MPKSRLRRYLILPINLLVVNLGEEVVVYKLGALRNAHLRTAAAMLAFGFGFSVAAWWMTPLVDQTLERLRRSGRRGWGIAGELVLLLVVVVALYYLYLGLYTRGPQAILPVAWHNRR